MAKLIEKLKTWRSDLPLAKRAPMVLVPLAVILLCMYIMMPDGQQEYVALYPSLGTDDTETILSALRAKGTPHRVASSADGSRAINVKSEDATRLRREFAEQGIPSASVVEGWSIVDKEGFGVSESKHRLNRLRALQGELARTITDNVKVVGARVHLALPNGRTLRLRKEKPSASVALKLRQNASLSKAEVRGIAYLVAQSVVGMETTMVSIVDNTGRLLHKPRAEDNQDSEEIDERRSALERKFEADIIRAIEPMVGSNRVIATVSVELNRTRIDSTEENFDAEEPAIRSKSTTTDSRGEKSGGSAGVSAVTGVPGVQANVPKVATGSDRVGSTRSTSSKRLTETTNFELSRVTRKSSSPAGTVHKVSVAILVDKKQAGEDAESEGVVAGRNPDELAEITRIAKSVVGFDERRGDNIEVAEARFQETIAATAANIPAAERDWVEIGLNSWTSVAVLVLCLLSLLVLGRSVKGLVEETTLYIRDAKVTRRELAAGAAGSLAEGAEEAGALGNVQSVQLPPGLTAEQAVAAAEALGVSPEEAMALAAAGDDRSAGATELDSRLGSLLNEISGEKVARGIDSVEQHADDIESMLRDLATSTPEGIAEALSFWMNERHA